MSNSIIEEVIGNNILVTNYIKDSINLTKSIIIKNDNEAKSYNEFISLAYPKFIIDYSDKTTWRYYKHLSGEYHELDKNIVVTSIDNGSQIVLSRNMLNLHTKTKKEILKFGLYYRDIVNDYPEQELFIKAIVSDTLYSDISDIVSLEDFSIVSYQDSLIEDNEKDLIFELQIAINNYKHTRLISYYALSDNLFLASQYHIFYNFILTKIMGIRLKNAKTLKAHSFHIKNYLASHHNLDDSYRYLTKKQSLFLYRNLLYLDNHSGSNEVFNTLIDKLFTARNISIVNYVYKQENALDDDNFIKYNFNQKLLNKTDLIYSANDFKLSSISNKEINLSNSNNRELTYNIKNIDNKFKNSLFNQILTKDLETIIIDNTDTVRYKLIPILIDYWAYLLKTDKVNFLVTIVDPVTNNEIKLNTKDLFKLLVVVLYSLNNEKIQNFPQFFIERVFKEDLPSNEELLNTCYKKQHWFSNELNTIKNNIPPHGWITTSSQCYDYVSSIYKLNIGLWLFLTNKSSNDVNGQFEFMIEKLHKSDKYTMDDETVDNFLSRITIADLPNYSKETLNSLFFTMLNAFYDNRLDFINSYKLIQKGIIDVFRKFNSYTVQIISDYMSSNSLIVGPKDTRYSTSKESNIKIFTYDFYNFNVDLDYFVKTSNEVRFTELYSNSSGYKQKYNIDLFPDIEFNHKSTTRVNILFNNKVLNNLDRSDWIINQSTNDQLDFLATHL